MVSKSLSFVRRKKKLTIDIKHWNMAVNKRISYHTIHTATHSCMKHNWAFGILATGIYAWTDTFLIDTWQIIGAIRVWFALWSTIRWNSFIFRQTSTLCIVINVFACWVSTAWSWNTRIDRFILFYWCYCFHRWWLSYTVRFNWNWSR